MTHTDQFEEIVKAFDNFIISMNAKYYSEISAAEAKQIADWWLSKLHHIRQEAEKEMVQGDSRRKFYQMGYDEAEKEYHLGLAELKAAMESLPDSKPSNESDEFDAGLREMKHACLNIIAERITLLT